jgi:membrane protein
LTPVPGVPIDPPQKDLHATAARLDERHQAAGLLFRVGHRFLYARIPLLSAGTTYYLFVSLISLVAFAYGLIALFGADWLADWLTYALDAAFPGLLEAEGVSADTIRDYGTASSIIGLVVLAVAGTGSVHAASQSLHVVYGAPKDPRNLVVARIRMIGQMLLLGPIILASFVPSLLFSQLARELSTQLGIEASLDSRMAIGLGTLLAVALNFLVVLSMLSWLGGIRPPWQPRLIGAAVGAVALEILKAATAAIISWSLGRPQYGAFAVPITLMLLLYLMSTAVYAAACLTAVLAVRRAESLVYDA